MFKSKALEITILSLKRLKVTDQGMDVVKPVLKIIWASNQEGAGLSHHSLDCATKKGRHCAMRGGSYEDRLLIFLERSCRCSLQRRNQQWSECLMIQRRYFLLIIPSLMQQSAELLSMVHYCKYVMLSNCAHAEVFCSTCKSFSPFFKMTVFNVCKLTFFFFFIDGVHSISAL